MVSVDIAELLPGARSVVVGWVEKTQHLYNVIALGCASLNPTYEYNIEALLKNQV
ncbi:MAG: hypothetical protein ACK4V9_07985 [Aphanizomenon sp.]|jgi:hypothetical protein